MGGGGGGGGGGSMGNQLFMYGLPEILTHAICHKETAEAKLTICLVTTQTTYLCTFIENNKMLTGPFEHECLGASDACTLATGDSEL